MWLQTPAIVERRHLEEPYTHSRSKYLKKCFQILTCYFLYSFAQCEPVEAAMVVLARVQLVVVLYIASSEGDSISTGITGFVKIFYAATKIDSV